MNFLTVGFIDPFELSASLPRRMGLFKDGVLMVRGPRAGADDPDDDVAYKQLLDVNKWPELKSMLAKIKRIGDSQGGIEFGRIYLELLQPYKPPVDFCALWMPPGDGYAERFNRLWMPLRTNPSVMHYSGIESAHLQHGVVTWINRRTPTSAINLGETVAVFLIVDTKIARKPDA